MAFLKLTSKENEVVYVNLSKVVAFERNGKGTRVKYESGKTEEVKESFTIVEYLLEHYVGEVI
ncbi:MAG: hypothetical protein K6A41_10880 [Bacteroidales bacterium]|nr:hypothetical protein [Bacteroidales bacterium]